MINILISKLHKKKEMQMMNKLIPKEVIIIKIITSFGNNFFVFQGIFNQKARFRLRRVGMHCRIFTRNPDLASVFVKSWFSLNAGSCIFDKKARFLFRRVDFYFRIFTRSPDLAPVSVKSVFLKNGCSCNFAQKARFGFRRVGLHCRIYMRSTDLAPVSKKSGFLNFKYLLKIKNF